MAREAGLRSTSFDSLILSAACVAVCIFSSGALAQDDQQHQSRVWFEFKVIDGRTSLAIRNAAVQLMSPFDLYHEESEIEKNEAHPAGFEINPNDETRLTDYQGILMLKPDFDVGETLNELWRGTRVKMAGWRVRVSALGYLPCTSPLFEFSGDEVDIDMPRVIRARVQLYRARRPGSDEEPGYETFVRRDFGFAFSLIVYQDKYYSLRSCPKLCSQHVPWFEAVRGRVERPEGELLLSIEGRERLPRRYGDEPDWFIDKLTRVNWGDRRYLVAENQWLAFCNAVNQGEEPRAGDYGDFYLGENHESITVVGLPEVPKSWKEYLLDAPIRGEVIETQADGSARINVGRKDGLRAGMELLPTKDSSPSDQIVVSVEENCAVIKPKYPAAPSYRKTQVGDALSTRRPPPRKAEAP
jgi:hypothetical protein